MQIEWFGQSAFRLDADGKTVAIDPFGDMSANGSMNTDCCSPVRANADWPYHWIRMQVLSLGLCVWGYAGASCTASRSRTVVAAPSSWW